MLNAIKVAIKRNISLSTLQSGQSKYAIDMVGAKFQRLLVIMYVGDRMLPKGQRQAMILAQCDCGHIGVYVANHVKGGRSKSCGCLQAEQTKKLHTTHGNKKGGMPRGTKEYSIWQSIKGRCKVNIQYHQLGIVVCERWFNSFENFIADVGLKPSPEHTLERIDNTKGYSPENCKWATRVEQANNTRRNRFIVVHGERLTFAQANRKYNIGKSRAKSLYNLQNKKAEEFYEAQVKIA
jgi:hypothetical protein